jgi:hypothetical protein
LNEGAKACVPPTAQQLLHTLPDGQAYVNLGIDVLPFRLVNGFTLFHDEKAIRDLHCETQYLLGHDQRFTPAAAPPALPLPVSLQTSVTRFFGQRRFTPKSCPINRRRYIDRKMQAGARMKSSRHT